MAPIRAYYLPTDATSDIDESRPVNIEKLSTLGWKISSVAGGHDEIEQAGLKWAQELGFPVTQEGCIVPFNFDVEKNVATMAPEVITMFALLMKAVEAENRKGKQIDLATAVSAVLAVTSGSPYVDVEDVTAVGWIRIHFNPGMIFCVPTGAKYRADFNEENKRTKGIAFFKETISNHGMLVKDEIDNHPTRQVYLNAHT
ncbi:hypothetical protein BDP27DRAFT_1366383 [Rhodocollybia butyracea]|uniref:Uncharacterized protein n=1 Tax=Rhodocollybia butyracea TaxID=206335 RepID=A0A9P5PLG9_9AGAR|nr:hypothetical protein BDP27DRAFT_1366383 [Rhodocollybia butyracea]